MDNGQNIPSLEDTSLESGGTIIESSPNQTPTTPSSAPSDSNPNPTAPAPPTDNTTPTSEKKPHRKLRDRFKSVNIYLLLFILVVVVAIFVTILSLNVNRKSVKTNNTASDQSLSQSDLNSIGDSNSQVGDAKQTLTIASNTVFSNKVLVRDNLDIAGTFRVGGSVTLKDITAAGTSNLDNLQVGGTFSTNSSATIQGDITSKGKLNIAGNGDFGGTLTASSLVVDKLSLNQDLSLSRHILSGGSSPSIVGGSALGNAGTVSLSGNDLAGTISVNIGSSPVAGVVATITFANAYSKTPHVVITPVGSAGGGVAYYVTRNSSSFTIGVSSAAGAGTSFAFDYIVVN